MISRLPIRKVGFDAVRGVHFGFASATLKGCLFLRRTRGRSFWRRGFQEIGYDVTGSLGRSCLRWRKLGRFFCIIERLIFDEKYRLNAEAFKNFGTN